jgi:hypothetical protein
VSTLVDLFQGLTLELQTALSPVLVERRYMPRHDLEDLQEMKISVFVMAAEHEEITRDIVSAERFSFGIAVQKAVGDQVPVDVNGNPVLDGIDNLAAGDAVLNQLEAIKDLWRPGGSLRNKPIAKCTFLEFISEPVYESIHLVMQGIFTGVLDVTYTLSEAQ